ncbi:MAG TPA: IPT/TIG domain-containing protein [Balneolaceae bacterium]
MVRRIYIWTSVISLVTVITIACQNTAPEQKESEVEELEIIRIEPSVGPVGTEVTIYGTGFKPDADANRVTFNGIEAEVKEATTSEILTTVPEGAETGSVSIETGNKSVQGPQFEVVTSGILKITTSTKKSELEPDGYKIFLNGEEQSRIGPAETKFIELDKGSYELELKDLINYCSPAGESNQSVEISVGDTTSVAFNVQCQAMLDNQIVFTRNNINTGYRTRLYVMNSDGSNVLELTENSDFDNSLPAISPNGEQIAFLSNVDINAVNFDVFIMDADGGNRVRLTMDEGYDENPSWSPDGTQIMFESSRGSNQDIYIINKDGSGLKRITTSSSADFDPHWSPTGDKVVFVTSRDLSFQVYIMGKDGSNQIQLTSVDYNFSPSWSPDGTQIAFVSQRDGNREIYTMNADGSNKTRLTNNKIQDLEPSWSPDGTQIIFFREEGIFKMNKDGTDIIQLTDVGDHSDGYPDWGPSN